MDCFNYWGCYVDSGGSTNFEKIFITMEAKDKAYIILLDYSNILQDSGNFTPQVKQCATRAVDEILNNLIIVLKVDSDVYEHYEKVIEEIKKLK